VALEEELPLVRLLLLEVHVEDALGELRLHDGLADLLGDLPLLRVPGAGGEEVVGEVAREADAARDDDVALGAVAPEPLAAVAG
jgi:hypothetical protein